MGSSCSNCSIAALRSNPHLCKRDMVYTTSVLPRDAGEDEGGGLIDLNGLNGLNLSIMEEIWRKLKSKRA
jgi:hypothetical protein